MKFLHPEFSIFGIIVLILLILNKKKEFTHIEFFKKKRFFNIPILDVLILIFLTLSLMYPIIYKEKKVNNFISYSYTPHSNKKRIVLILDVSLSMKDYFEDEKEIAKSIVSSHKGDYIMLVVFEGDYMIVKNFTTDIDEIDDAIENLKLNMVTSIGGSFLRDTVASIINSFKNLNPKIYILSDGGGKDDSSSTTKEELKNLSKNMNIKYIGFGDSQENKFYESIFHSTKEKKSKPIKKFKNISKTIKYKTYDIKFAIIALILLLYKLIKVRFENRFNSI
ncbi:vWA domain-containing protein [Caminibacter sp.]